MLKLVNVSKYYSSNNVIALGLRKVNLELRKNEFVAIVGESGSGKTTLLNVICGIDTYEEGEMYLHGEETSYYGVSDMENYRKKYVAFVFQNYNLIDSYTVLQNVEAPLILAGYPKKEIRPRAMEIIRRVGLEDHVRHKATKLSGGQKQRVVIARALAKNAPIIAADEPTGNLDSAAAKQIIELLHEIAKDKLVIVVTHDYEQVKEYATRKIRIFDGEIVEDVEVAPTAKADLPKVADAETKLKFREYFAIALRNLAAVPKKTILMILVFTVFSFFVAMVYGSFNAAMRDTENYGNMYFQNTSLTRIVVRKGDASPFTADELQALRDDNSIQTVIPFDFAMDYSLFFSDTEANEWGYYDYISPFPLPLELASEDDIVAGRMPTAADEVVLVTNENSIEYYTENYLGISVRQGGGWDYRPATGDAFEIVGLATSESLGMTAQYYSDFILLDDDVFARYARQFYVQYGIVTGAYEGVDNLGEDYVSDDLFASFPLMIDEAIADDVIQFPEYGYGECDVDEAFCSATGTITVTDHYMTRTTADIHIDVEIMTADTFDSTLRMNEATYLKIFGADVYQVSVIAVSGVATEPLMRRLAAQRDAFLLPKYKILHPYESAIGQDFMELIILFNIVWSSVAMAATLLMSTLLTYIIFRAVINTKMHDYAIFRTIGASQKMIKRFIYLENGYTAVVAFAIVLTVILALQPQLEFVRLIFEYYTFGSYVVLFLIMIAMSLLISRKYCRRVFKESVHRTLKAE